jgi:hypothetical protein
MPSPIKDFSSQALSENILHNFRSYNAIFTLSCIPRGKIKSKADYKGLENINVIARSYGKSNADVQDNILGSSNRYNFYFNNIEFLNRIGFDGQTGMSMASSLDFDIFEPFGLTGFLRALQETAVKAKYADFRSAVFLLKVEFVGYLDANSATGQELSPIMIEPASRYFPFIFRNIEVKTDETGTRYICKCLPFNELAFGETNKLTNSISIEGGIVKNILTDLAKYLTNSNSSETEGAQADKFNDIYEINFKKRNNTGTGFEDSEDAEIAMSSVDIKFQDDMQVKFSNPADDNISKTDTTTKKKNTYIGSKQNLDSSTPVIMFSNGSNIHDVITAIVRDSSYGINAIRTPPDSDGMIDYFFIGIETEYLSEWNTTKNRYCYKYIYNIYPFKLHYTRIPLFQSKKIDSKPLLKRIRRRYNWIYTGKNKDLITFNLNFNYLYYQSVPNADLGKGANFFTKQTATIGDSDQDNRGPFLAPETQEAQLQAGYGLGPAPVYVNQALNENRQAGGGSTRGFSGAAYELVRNFHQALLDNSGMMQADIEILGDPFFLVQGGLGNMQVQTSSLPGITTTGAADHLEGDIMIRLSFKNPVDYDATTGLLKPPPKDLEWSGFYRVKEVVSRFSDGQFKQKLKLLRLPAQPDDDATPVISVGLIDKIVYGDNIA